MSRENLSKQKFIVAVRGSPGIGKSRSSLLYIRELMQQTAHRPPIIFEFGESQSRTTYLITPSELSRERKAGGPSSGNIRNEWIVYTLPQSKVPSEWSECPIIDFVIDPAQFPKDESPSPSALAEAASGHCFIPVSLDDRHLGGSHKTASRLLQFVMSPWKVAFLT